jgi:leader peptidase (prepilin peptidase)/N-methyltransferase
VTAGLVGLATGWAWALLFLLYLVPVGVGLAYVDYRTRLLPTRIIAPSYLVMIVLVPLCALLDQDLAALVRAVLGWAVAGFVFWFLWRFTPGMGYGDVRLSGVLGLALGYLGWSELLIGIYAGFIVGVVGWLPLRLLRITRDRQFPFGPFMLVGAVVGILWGPAIASGLGYGSG